MPGEAPTAVQPTHERAKRILQGFKIDWMNLSSHKTKQLFWKDEQWDDLLVQKEIHIPAKILKCNVVAREFQFSSVSKRKQRTYNQRTSRQTETVSETHSDPPLQTTARRWSHYKA